MNIYYVYRVVATILASIDFKIILFKDSKLHDICSTSSIVHPTLMGEYTDFEAYLWNIHF